MEWGERPEQTAIRELAEETGLSARVGRVLGIHSAWFESHEAQRGEAGHHVGIVYETAEVTGEIRTHFHAEDTTDAAAWFSMTEAYALSKVPLVDFVLDLIA